MQPTPYLDCRGTPLGEAKTTLFCMNLRIKDTKVSKSVTCGKRGSRDTEVSLGTSVGYEVVG